MTGHIDAERILDAFLAPEHDQLPDRVVDAALTEIARTPQRRALRVPWRFPLMPQLLRFAVAAVVLVAVAGVGGALLFTRPGNIGPGAVAPTQTATAAATAVPTPTATAAPTATPGPTATPAPSEVAPGITGWTPYRSEVYRFRMGYPSDWTVFSPATRTWQAADAQPETRGPSWEVFTNPSEVDGEDIALFVSEVPISAVPSGDNIRLSIDGLKDWAREFCDLTADGTVGGASTCEGWADQAIPMCYDPDRRDGIHDCQAAIIVPDEETVSAYFVDRNSTVLGPTVVRVISIGRPPDWPASARYGGGVQLMKSILTEMDVVDR